MSRQSRKEKSLAAREEKVNRLRRFHVFALSLLFRAATHGRYHDEFLLPKEMDVNLTARQVDERFGHQCREIFERLFIRWTTKWKSRPAVWKVNVVVAQDYVPWVQDNLDVTPAEALAFLKGLGAERLRRARIYSADGPGDAVIL